MFDSFCIQKVNHTKNCRYKFLYTFGNSSIHRFTNHKKLFEFVFGNYLSKFF